MHYENKQLYSSARNDTQVDHTPCVPTTHKGIPKPPPINPKIFLDELFKNTKGHLMLASKQGKRFKGVYVEDTQAAADYAIQHMNTEDMYFGINLLNKIPAPGKRGKAEDIQCITCVHVDIDICGEGHTGNKYPKTQKEALQIAKTFPLPPSIVVNSGGGLHVYWLFNNPLYTKSDDERDAAKEFVLHFQQTIRTYAARHGYTIDSTHDLPRVLRVPGTYNHKNGNKRQVEWINFSEGTPRYSVKEIKKHLIPKPPQTTPVPLIKNRQSKESADHQFPLSNFELILKRCSWMQHCKDDAATLTEPEWYAMLGILIRCIEGENHAHKMSAAYPGYSQEETSEKIKHASKCGPQTCDHIHSTHEFYGCTACPFRKHIKTPIQLGDPDELRQAVLTITPVFYDVENSIKLIYQPEVLEAFVTVKRMNLIEYAKLRKMVKNIGVRLGDFDAIIKAAEQEYAEKNAEVVPLYFIEKNQFFHNKVTNSGVTKVLLSDFIAEIIEETTVDDGYSKEKMYRIAGHKKDGTTLPTFNWPAAEFKGLNFIDNIYGTDALCYPGQNAHLCAAIKSLSKKVKKTTTYAHIGWRKIDGNYYYLSAAGALSATGIRKYITVSLDGGLEIYSIPLATQEEMFAGMTESLKMIDMVEDCVSIPLFILTYRAIFAECFPVEYSLYFHGYTGSKKSTLIGVLQSYFGKDNKKITALGNWISTDNSCEKLAALAKDAPFSMDDYVENGSSAKRAEMNSLADRIFRGQANKAGRGRLGNDLKIQKAYIPEGLIIGTGEQVPEGSGGADSMRARMLILQLVKGTVNNKILSGLQKAGRKGLLAASSAALIQWLAPRIDTFRTELVERKDKVRDENLHLEEIHSRAPENYADLQVSLEVILECFRSYNVITQTESDALTTRGIKALKFAMKRHGEYLKDSSASQYLHDFQQALNNGSVHLVNAVDGNAPSDPHLWGWKYDPATGLMSPQGIKGGYKKDEEVYIIPAEGYALYEASSDKMKRQNKKSETQIHKLLYKEGFLIDRDGNTYPVKRTTVDGRPRVLLIRKEDLC